MIYRVECLFRSKNTPTTYLPVSRAFDTLCRVFFPKSKLIFIEHYYYFKEVNNLKEAITFQIFLEKNGKTDMGL